ncbi:Rne/Rng family ribonuclease [Salinibacterium hongtaonis]|uniref:Ribonuclease E n=1 Tax=Homoserinimonas hongtaonis TaxID=2079791 RepID=A0A2U1SZ44_9MICO|nr:Rne/Rng family ribonuclease [Salinibacterium hongtaonis]PWB96900.1 ribonuclease E/G [Salinibacterium hongtaonis]
MVDTNENNDGTQKDGVRKRVRLFGSRRKAAEKTVTAPSTTPAIVEEAIVAEPIQQPANETAPAVEAPVVEKAAEVDSSSPEPVQAKTTRARAPRKAKSSEVSPEASADDAAAPTEATAPLVARSTTSLFFKAPDLPTMVPPSDSPARSNHDDDDEEPSSSARRRTRRRSSEDDAPESERSATVTRTRAPRVQPEPSNEPQKVRGSTRLEAKKQRRRDGRDAGRRRPVVTEAEFLARRESVDRTMVVRQKNNRIQIGVLEDGVLVEHYVAQSAEASLIGNVYLGRVQNVLPSMEAAFVDIGRGRNAVLYSGEVDWDAAAENSAEGKNQARRIELALKPGDKVLVQVTKDPVGHKGARLTSQVSLPGRYLVYVPNGSMNGISRKLPDTERARLKKILKEVLPDNTGVIVRTAAEGATEEQLTLDVNRLTSQWASISAALETVSAPALLHSEPDLLVKIVRDVFNEDFHKLVIDGEEARATITNYLSAVAPDLVDRIEKYEGDRDSFDQYRISEQIEKALDRKVWLPSGGSLVIDRTEAMTVVDVNTGKFVGSGGNLEETVTKNNLEAAEEIVRQLRLRDIGGIIVVDFIDMVLESNRDLVLRRLVECLSRDRTKHQVAEVTSLGLVQMTRKKLGLGLIESFSEACEACAGRGIIIHHDPVVKHRQSPQPETRRSRGGKGNNGGGNNNGGNGGNSSGPQGGGAAAAAAPKTSPTHVITEDVKNALAQIAASTIAGTIEAGTAHDGASAEQNAGETPEQAPAKSGRSRRSRSKASTPAASESPAESAEAPAMKQDADATQSASHRESVESVEVVEILDIPVVKSTSTAKRVSTRDAEEILGSLLDALPEPKQPGQGRSRGSRRASSAGVVQAGTAQTVTAED